MKIRIIIYTITIVVGICLLCCVYKIKDLQAARIDSHVVEQCITDNSDFLENKKNACRLTYKNVDKLKRYIGDIRLITKVLITSGADNAKISINELHGIAGEYYESIERIEERMRNNKIRSNDRKEYEQIINILVEFNKVIIKQMTEGEKVSIDQAYDSIKWNTTDELTKKIDKIQ